MSSSRPCCFLEIIGTDLTPQGVTFAERVAMLREYLCAVRVGWWIWWSAAIVRWCSLPGLCREASLHARLSTPRLDPARVAAIVSRVSRLPLFSLPIFPRACMRQSLALYRELTRMGYPAAIHFGVHRAGAGLSGHSWVTLDGVPISESHSLEQLTITYSHSARWSSP